MSKIEPHFPHNVDGLEVRKTDGTTVVISPSEARKLVAKGEAEYTGKPAHVGPQEHTK